MSNNASAPNQAPREVPTVQPPAPPAPAAEPALPVFAGDRFAMLLWIGCAMLMALLLMKDLVVSLCRW